MSLLSNMLCIQTLNGRHPRIRTQATTPKEYRSHEEVQGVSTSFSANISGAIYPMVPHLSQRYFQLVQAASPKSTSTHSPSDSRITIFQGFKSLCIMLFSCRQLSALSESEMILVIKSPISLPLFLMKSTSVPPERYSVTKQIRLSVSQIPSNLMIFGWLKVFNMCISFCRDQQPMQPIFCPSLENTFAAIFQPEYLCCTKQTAAKLPLPNLFKGLKNSLNPLWEIYLLSLLQTICKLGVVLE